MFIFVYVALAEVLQHAHTQERFCLELDEPPDTNTDKETKFTKTYTFTIRVPLRQETRYPERAQHPPADVVWMGVGRMEE